MRGARGWHRPPREFLFKIMEVEVDHVVPRSRGGTDHPENLQLLCPNCNRIKGDRDMAYLVARLGEGRGWGRNVLFRTSGVSCYVYCNTVLTREQG